MSNQNQIKENNEAVRLVSNVIRYWAAGMAIISALLIYYAVEKVTLLTFTPTLQWWVPKLILSATFLIILVFIFDGAKNASVSILKLQILCLSVSVAIAIVVTGGILDSPFAGVLGLFVSSFIAMQSEENLKRCNTNSAEKIKLRKFNFWLVVITVSFLVVPPGIAHLRDCSPALVVWDSTNTVIWLRLLVTVFLLVGTGCAAHILSERLSKIEIEKANED